MKTKTQTKIIHHLIIQNKELRKKIAETHEDNLKLHFLLDNNFAKGKGV